jgi:hypothetical protein
MIDGFGTERHRTAFGELATLDQRIAVRYQMTGMALDDGVDVHCGVFRYE